MDAKKLITAVLFFSGSLGLAQKPDSVFIVASDASAPVVLYKVDAEYTVVGGSSGSAWAYLPWYR
jgi:hypothetical protein